MYPLVIISRQVKAKACGICEKNAALSLILNNCAACDNIKLWKHSVFQSNGNIGGSIFEIYFKCLRFVLRYGELRRLLDGVTHKMLTNQLKELAADGLVQRIDYAEVPPRVEYRLTADGQALMPIFDDIQAYIKTSACRSCCTPQQPRKACCGDEGTS